MIKIGILGGSGYTAMELIKILLRHPEVEITCLTTRQETKLHVSEVHPQLAGMLDLRLLPLSASEVAEQCDCVFSCLPHAASASAIHEIIAGGTRVIDFSADYRIWDAELYEQWYQVTHPDPDRLGEVPYGLPELFRDKIRNSQVVANPGCYPTSAILAMAPLVRHSVVDPNSIIFDSKSGVSGAGRNPKLMTHYPECNESIAAYAVGQHRHTPEISQILGSLLSPNTQSNQMANVIFTPHLVPMDRGILTTGYARLAGSDFTAEDAIELFRNDYADEPFVQIVNKPPKTKDVTHTNGCHICVKVVGDYIITLSVIDNLIKGASGAAVQNMNLMFGFDETTALR